MSLALRTRLSLGLRMLTALFVLFVVSILVGLTAVLVSGFVIWLGLLAVAFVASFPLTVVLEEQFLLLGWLLDHAVPVVVLAGLFVLPILYLQPVREEIRDFRTELTRTGTLARERHPEVAAMARRLAQQAGIPEPDVSIVNRRRPESYAIGGRSDGTIVVNRGLVRQLTDAELQAVLAHEIGHLVNGDSRVLHLALIPMLVAEEVGSTERPAWIKHGLLLPMVYLAHLTAWAVLRAITAVQGWVCRFGVTYLSRGREFAADRTAAQLTGEPSALASALRTLDDERGTPSEDERTWRRSTAALDILPHDEADGLGGVFRTHPSTEKRIEKLERLVVAMEGNA